MKQASILLASSALGVESLYAPYQQYLSSTVATANRFGDSVYIGPGRPWVVPVQNPTTTDLSIIYPYYDNTANAPALFSPSNFIVFNDPVKVALSPAEGINNNLFVSYYTSPYSGKVLFYQGEYTTWSVQQTLSPPDTVDLAKNYFGSTLAFDVDSNFDTLFVGCGNCSSIYGRHHGAIYLYEQDKGPGKNAWSATQKITHRNLNGLGRDRIVPHKDLLMATTTTANYPVALFRRVGKEYEPEQLLGVGQTITSFDVYDDTIILAASGVASGATAGVGAVYILASAKQAAPKGKPQPVQWSVQQVLRPYTTAANLLFGSSISLDKNRLAVTEGITSGSNRNIYVFEKDSSVGKWSVQQRFDWGAVNAFTMDVILKDSQLLLATNNTRVQLYDQYVGAADCLYVSLEDLFGDGWDTAQLRITTPDGSRQYYQSRCDLGNPHQFRFCPEHIYENGVYHFEIIDAAPKAKNFWEIQWRVYNPVTAKWYVGHHDTRMDFEWDSSSQKFTARKMDHVAPNVTCTYCTPPPTDKPTPVLRSRALKDDLPAWPNTRHPTSTPAPTVSNTNLGINWRVAILGLNPSATTGWFRNDYKGAAYYVSDAKSRRLITSGTLCPGEANAKQCWIDLPDGDYSIRVGGGLLKTPASIQFKYCRMDRYAPGQTQINVKIRDGECRSLSSHAQSAYCKNTNAAIVVAIEFVVLGVSDGSTLSLADSDALAAAVASAFPGLTKSDVQITSATPGAGGVYVSAHVALHESIGYDALSVEGIENAMASVETYMAGNGPRAIWSGLQSAEHRTVFSTSTSVQFISAEVAGSKDDLFEGDVLTAGNIEEVVDYFDQPTSTANDKSSASTTDMILNYVSASGYFLAVGAFIALVVGMVVTYRRATTAPQQNADKSYSELEGTEHSTGRVQLKDLNLSTPNVSDLKQFVESEDRVLKMMLSRST